MGVGLIIPGSGGSGGSSNVTVYDFNFTDPAANSNNGFAGWTDGSGGVWPTYDGTGTNVLAEVTSVLGVPVLGFTATDATQEFDDYVTSPVFPITEGSVVETFLLIGQRLLSLTDDLTQVVNDGSLYCWDAGNNPGPTGDGAPDQTIDAPYLIAPGGVASAQTISSITSAGQMAYTTVCFNFVAPATGYAAFGTYLYWYVTGLIAGDTEPQGKFIQKLVARVTSP